MKVTVYTIPGSHPGTAAQLMLDHKGIPFKRKDLFPVVSKGVLQGSGLPPQHCAGDQDRRREGAGLPADRA